MTLILVMMEWWYLVGVLVSYPLIVGMVFASMQGPKMLRDRRIWRREDLGIACVFSLLFAAVWPIGLPLVWATTGFAEHGIRFK